MAHSLIAALTPTAASSLRTPHTLIPFIAALVCLVLTVALPILVTLTRSQQRRLFWAGVVATNVFAALVPLPDWKRGLGFAVFGVAFMTAGAYMNTSHIKIRGKIYAYHVSDSQPGPTPDAADAPQHSSRHTADTDVAPDSYGGIATAQKSWWNMVVAMVFIDFGILVPLAGMPWMRYAMGAVLVVVAAVFGYGDGSWRYPLARGQRLQFAIITIMTAGVFAVIYVAAFGLGRRWPYRNPRSLEYRAHPRFQSPEGDHGAGSPPPS